ncbi:unnamed protein product, partial [Rotaria socialis]
MDSNNNPNGRLPRITKDYYGLLRINLDHQGSDENTS